MAMEDVTEAAAGTTVEGTAYTVKRYPVAPGYRINVRSGPGTNYSIVKVLAEGVRVPINCQKPGTTVTGPYGTTNLWDNIANGQYVSDAYVNTGSDGYVAVRCS
ncbi:peptidase [Streptomyces sp. WAC05374]|uniref:peptidase n=1 Tax=Streptomyces sp. WAC05374 TaxID=2487420 RepID=UPI000F8666AD|nr:peptidase [Streptomyces sp. WAC05374]RST07603.1 peptidase [Streptomyces sp. WAC05374]TDF40006.1 peptidase [Streptomyces sp. WAC05374]TDF48020.1 peptidase [Streptomyces sp. WAC05374]TDF59636.1 peptidase [Streptomyces sp. WAC05374]